VSRAVILSAVRTPTGKFLGALKGFSATQLGALAVAEAVRRAGIDPQIVDECIMGLVVSAGLGQNPARQAALNGGLPEHVAALTINKVCGSGLKAVMIADQAIRAGDVDVAVAGGMESMSNVPYYLPGARTGYRLGHQQARREGVGERDEPHVLAPAADPHAHRAERDRAPDPETALPDVQRLDRVAAGAEVGRR